MSMPENAGSVSRRRIMVAGLVGNAMEWYDFAVYGYFATVIGRQFFPSDNPAVSLIAAFGAFAAGFLVSRSAASCSAGSAIWSAAGVR